MANPDAGYYPNAPVVETVLAVQFDPLPGFGNGHFGWFWREVLGKEWIETKDAPPVPDQFEYFHPEGTVPPPRLVLKTAGPTDRVQFIHQSDDQVVQLQQTRLMLNWRKRGQSYPRFPERLAKFKALWESWCDFCNRLNLGTVQANQWEVTYFNHIPSAELWNSVRDWHSLLPGLCSDVVDTELLSVDSCEVQWHFEIRPRRGRLHVRVNRAIVDNKPVLVWVQTSRGKPETMDWTGLEAGLQIGHDAIIEAFEQFSSEAAKSSWK